jgi:hypothetical protein
MLDVLDFRSIKHRVDFKIKTTWYQNILNDEITYNRDATKRILRNKDDFRYKKTYTPNSMWDDGIISFSTN